MVIKVNSDTDHECMPARYTVGQILSGYLLKSRHTVNPLLSPPGAYLFQAYLRGGGGLIETGSVFVTGA